jgi:hypothetical protein
MSERAFLKRAHHGLTGLHQRRVVGELGAHLLYGPRCNLHPFRWGRIGIRTV